MKIIFFSLSLKNCNFKTMQFLISILYISLISFSLFSQTKDNQINRYLSQNIQKLDLSISDISDLRIYNQHSDQKTGLTYLYLIQRHANLDVYNANAVFVKKKNKVYLTGNRFQKNIKSRVNVEAPFLSPKEALEILVRNLGITNIVESNPLRISKNQYLFDKEFLSQEDIPVDLIYVPYKKQIRLAWDISVYMLDGKHWWSIKIDALTGQEIDRVDWVSSCNYHSLNSNEQQLHLPPPTTDEYRVFPYPVESPNHGVRTLLIGPSDTVASPYGWHDTDGSNGAEYTITRGNNVLACEDQNGNNGTGASPDGGALLQFDFPLNLNQAPSAYVDAATTNLFYANNVMHDVWYHYGFTSAAGNFQQNTYGLGGLGSDYVRADAQDGSGMNNANFATPPDGSKPRMQMFLWTPPPNGNILTVNSPSSLSGSYYALPSGFGPSISSTPITSDIVIYNDSVPDNYDACELPTNASALNGKIVLIRRGSCTFVDKIQRAQDAGAISVIMANNVSGNPITMGGTSSTITIPALMISDIDGAAIIAQIESGGTVNATIVDSNATNYDLDGDFDNKIIAHEYGHGISNRLTAGASNTSCLGNDEQMGEGWSDWFGLMLTIEPGDQSTDIRGVGTYVKGQSTTGNGIRPAPYCTDFLINGYTYSATNNTAGISKPHGVGFV
ncbi:MAG: M36 family metallopeptidase, partial [Crocinitomicaceae bacterium]|nr:M36 family metallopeptidase [Crocinitomicaceae bacterium]